MSFSSEILTDTPLLYYRMGDVSGTQCTDTTANARHGTYQGSPTLQQVSLVAAEHLTDFSVSLDGVNDCIAVPDVAITGTSYSFACAFKAPNITGLNNQLILSFAYAAPVYAGQYGIALLSDTSDRRIAVLDPANRFSSRLCPISNRAHILHAVFTNLHVKMFLDGTVILDSGTNIGVSSPTLQYFFIGRYHPDPANVFSTTYVYTQAVVDEVALFQGTLSDARVTAHATAFFTADYTREVTHLRTLRARRSFQQPIHLLGV